MNKKFWKNIDELIATSRFVIDRPKNSRHPQYLDFIYPVDYGFLEKTKASDGKEIDIWIGSLPQKVATAILCTVDRLKRDMETKILIGCTEEEIKIIFDTMNNSHMSAIVVFRNSFKKKCS